MPNRFYLVLLVSILLGMLSPISSADNLCDPACDIRIDFTDSGSIEAIEALVIEFGTGGILDLGTAGTLNVAVPPASLDYSAGGVLSLAAGESITFGAGGMLDLGEAGNIDYTSLNLTVHGEANIGTSADTGTVTLSAGSMFSFSSGSSWVSASNFSNSGTISVSGGSDLTLSSTGSFMNTGSGLSTGTLTIGTTTFNNVGLVPALEISNVIVDIGGSFTLSDPGVTNFTIEPGSFTLNTFTQEDLVFFEGVEMATADGGNCIVTDGECFTSAGAKYVVNADGELVPVEEGSSRLHPVFLAVMAVWYLLRRRLRH